MPQSEAKYTLWTIPKSEWSESPFRDIKLTEAQKKELIEFARNMKDERLEDVLRPFNTPVTQDTLNRPVGSAMN